MFSIHVDVSENSGTPKSSILIGFSIITIHFGAALFLETPTWNLPKNSTTTFPGPACAQAASWQKTWLIASDFQVE